MFTMLGDWISGFFFLYSISTKPNLFSVLLFADKIITMIEGLKKNGINYLW